jgi:hypothetical protein
VSDVPVIHPDRAKLEELLGFATARWDRATVRSERANREVVDASEAVTIARANLETWIAANPDLQHDMFEETDQ